MANPPLKIDLIASAAKLAASGQSSVALFQQGDANLLLFVPTDQDTQQAHKRDELYVIHAGQGIFKRGGETVRFAAGDVLFVPAGVPHSEGNPGPGDIEGVVELRPALRTKEFHEALAGLVADGKTTSRGAPRNPLQLGATFWHFRRESRVTSPPVWAQNLMLPPLWAIAKVFGVRPYYDSWESQL